MQAQREAQQAAQQQAAQQQAAQQQAAQQAAQGVVASVLHEAVDSIVGNAGEEGATKEE